MTKKLEDSVESTIIMIRGLLSRGGPQMLCNPQMPYIIFFCYIWFICVIDLDCNTSQCPNHIITESFIQITNATILLSPNYFCTGTRAALRVW